ncbi:MAG: GNAT family N-acetyltransferase [Clostridia bacterium]|nr:GNAT family N-acetyltransferase [Clostridia bacterium]
MNDFRFVRYDHRRHLEPLFDYMMSPEEQSLFLTHSISNSIRDFDNWLQDRLKYHYHEFFVVESLEGELMGVVYSYDHRMQDGHCRITVYMAPKWRRVGYGGMVGLRFIGQLFRFYPYHHIFCDVYRYNEESLNSLLQAGFENVGTLPQYRYHNGRYHDLVQLSISRLYYTAHWAALFTPEIAEVQE